MPCLESAARDRHLINDVNRFDRRSSSCSAATVYEGSLEWLQLDTRHVNEEIGRLIGNAGESPLIIGGNERT